MTNYTVVSGIHLLVEGNFPKVIHPEIDEHVGNSKLRKEFFITGVNQKEYFDDYTLDTTEMVILDEEFNDNRTVINTLSHGKQSCKVIDSEIYIMNDRYGHIYMNIEIPIHSPTYNEAIESVDRLLSSDNVKLDSLMFVDLRSNEVYTCNVKDMEVSEYLEVV